MLAKRWYVTARRVCLTVSLDTVRADSVDPKDASDLSLRQILEQLKASNSWYESELAAARESGYVPSSRPPVDVLKLRRVSQLVSQDTDKSLSERTILIEALSDLKSELNQVQNSIQSQAEQASAKIAEAETDRDNAYKRTQLLEEQLKASDDREISRNSISEEREEELLERISTLEKELSDQVKLKEVLFGKATSQDLETNLQLFDMEKIRSDNISLEQQLRTFSDRNILAQHEASRYKSQLRKHAWPLQDFLRRVLRCMLSRSAPHLLLFRQHKASRANTLIC